MPSSPPVQTGASPPFVPSGGSLVQPITSGFLAAITGFASAFAIVLAGFHAVGATPEQAASGLFAVTLLQGVLGIALSFTSREPITIAWSTPGAALLIASGAPAGGYAVAVGAFLVAAVLVVIAGLWRAFGRAVSAIPVPLASAMLAGVLLELCLAPVRAVVALPLLALPICAAWVLALRFARGYAVPIAVVVTAILIYSATDIPPAALAHVLPAPLIVMPVFTLAAAVGIGVPLFIVTMASQNVPGLAVLAVNGYRPSVGPIFVWTGLGSVVSAFLGGHTLNLAAITAALCAGPEAHPDPARRWIASVACGVTYLCIALVAGFAASFVAASPPLLIEAVAGLALFGSLAGAFSSALADADSRLPAIVAFVTTASGAAFLGIGAAFWGLIAGGVVMFVLRFGRA